MKRPVSHDFILSVSRLFDRDFVTAGAAAAG